ncbi:MULTISPECIES: hypothetical protein [Burkholderia]|nr:MULTISPECIES: hypothetical protein [Burkholderia]MBN3742178.1 hypothetical protein [Burkholderia sp. Tr-20355]
MSALRGGQPVGWTAAIVVDRSRVAMTRPPDAAGYRRLIQRDPGDA